MFSVRKHLPHTGQCPGALSNPQTPPHLAYRLPSLLQHISLTSQASLQSVYLPVRRSVVLTVGVFLNGERKQNQACGVCGRLKIVILSSAEAKVKVSLKRVKGNSVGVYAYVCMYVLLSFSLLCLPINGHSFPFLCCVQACTWTEPNTPVILSFWGKENLGQKRE